MADDESFHKASINYSGAANMGTIASPATILVFGGKILEDLNSHSHAIIHSFYPEPDPVGRINDFIQFILHIGRTSKCLTDSYMITSLIHAICMMTDGIKRLRLCNMLASHAMICT